MKILITGGAGYIGSVITNFALQSNYKVRVIDKLWFDEKIPLIHHHNPNYEFIRADLCDAESLDSFLAGADFIVHAAAVVGEPASKKFAELTNKVNLEASLRLIEKSKQAGVKGVIFLSTCSNYGIAEAVATEETPLTPLSLYAKTKVGVERYLMDNCRDIDWVICRLSTAYGSSPRMRLDLTVNDFTMNAFINKYLDIFLPYTYRPYIHVFDVAKVVIRMINDFEQVKNNVFNVGFDGENYQKQQIVEIIKKFIPDVYVEFVKEGLDARDYRVNFSKLKKYLNIENTYTVEDGVKQIIEMIECGLINDPKDKKYYNTSPNLEDRKWNWTHPILES